MAIVKEYFTIINNVRFDSEGRSYVDTPEKFLEYNFAPDITVTKLLTNSSDRRSLYMASGDNTITTMDSTGATVSKLEFMLSEGMSNFNCQRLTGGATGTALAIYDYFSPARVVVVDTSTHTYAAAAWNTTTLEVEQTITIT